MRALGAGWCRGDREVVVGFGDAVRSGLSKYVVFSGRARRSEFWFFYLFGIVAGIVALVLDAVLGTGPLLYAVTALALFLPNLAIGVRRLHDTGKSGAYYLFILIPLVGGILLVVWWCKDSDPGANAYGPSPKDGSSAFA